LVFNEPLALRWWIGATFILAGTILLSQSQKKLEQAKTNSDKKTD
jgi:drug/metabolite transporter (DMT)-like permease